MIKKFEQFIKESYSGPVSVIFKNESFSPIMNKVVYFTIDGKIHPLDFYSFPTFDEKSFISLEKELKTKGFDTKIDTKKRVILLNGFYEVIDANNNNSKLVQTSKNHTIEFNIPTFYLKKGKVEYSEDRPN